MAFGQIIAAVTGVGALVNMLRGYGDVPQPSADFLDLDKELDKIRIMYSDKEAYVRQSLLADLGEMNTKTAESLASRNILSSPLSQRSFGQNNKAYMIGLGKAMAEIKMQEANAEAGVLDMKTRYKQELYKTQYASAMSQFGYDVQGRNAITGLLTSVATAAATHGKSDNKDNKVDMGGKG